MRKYKYVLFDLDGTLTNPQKGMDKAIWHTLKSLNIKTDLTDFSHFIGPPLRDNFRDIFGLKGEMIEKAVIKYREYYEKKGLLENELYPGIIPLLQTLKQRNIKIAMATSKVTDYANTIAAHFDFAQYFGYICGSELNGERSAKSEIIAHIFKNFIPPEEANNTIMIGDRKYDIIGANSAKIDSIGVLWGFGSPQELQEAGATYLAKTPQDVLDILQG